MKDMMDLRPEVEAEVASSLIPNWKSGKVEIMRSQSPIQSFPSTKSKRRRPLTLAEKGSLATLCFINLLNYMDRFTLSAVLDQVQAHFVLSNEEAGLVQTVYTLAYMIFALPFGYWGDRYSRRWGMGVGVAVWAAATLLGSFVGHDFVAFLVTRGLVGLGQASFSTIAPTLISDMVADNMRSRVLAAFYFLLPIGSGLGYIVGAAAADVGGSWAWSLRVTPILGGVALLLICLVLVDPPRGACEGASCDKESKPSSSYLSDIYYLLRNKSFMLSTMGYTSVAFVSGALAWWGPVFLASGFAQQDRDPEDEVKMTEVSFQFGIAMMFSGLIGVPIGSFTSQKLRVKSLQADPLICAVALGLSAPVLWGAAVLAVSHTWTTLILIFCGMLTLNLTWCIVADILLYTVVPSKRSAAQGLQILISFALGAAISPYVVGLLTDLLTPNEFGLDPKTAEYKGLSRALYLVYAVEVLGALFFLLTAAFIKADKDACDNSIRQNGSEEGSEKTTTEA